MRPLRPFAAMLAFWSFANVPAQDFHRHLAEGHPLADSFAPATDGGMFALYRVGVDTVVVKIDEAGDLEWTKRYGRANHLVPTPDGGVWVCSAVEWLESVPMETVLHGMRAVKVSGDGTVLVRRDILIEMDWNYSSYFSFSTFLPLADGGFIMMSMDFDKCVTLRVGADGVPSGASTDLTTGLPFIYDQPRCFELSDGSIVIVVNDNMLPDPYIYANRIHMSGTMDRWLIQRTATAHNLLEATYFVDGNDDLLIAYNAISILNPYRWLVASKISMAGDIVWDRAYRHSTWQPHLQSHLGHETTSGLYRLGGSKYVELDQDGDLVHISSCSTPLYADEFVIDAHELEIVLLPDDEVCYAGHRRWQDPQFGFTVYMPMLGRTYADLESSCLWQCVTPAPHEEVAVPAPMFEVIPLAPGSMTPPFWLHVYSNSLPVVEGTDVPWQELGDACDLPEIVATSVEPATSVAPDMLAVHPNPVAQGGTLFITPGTTGHLRILDALGREVTGHSLTNGSQLAMSTSGWSSGLYLVRLIGKDMRTLGVRRVVVE